MNDTHEDFIKNHNIRIVDANKRRSVTRRATPCVFFTNPADYNSVDFLDTMDYDTETVLTLEISENELARIAGFESEVFNNMRDYGHYNMFELLMDLKSEENKIRKANPAVQKAYEHYSMLLNLAKVGPQ